MHICRPLIFLSLLCKGFIRHSPPGPHPRIRLALPGRLIFIHLQCWEVLRILTFQRQRCIKILCPKDPEFYTPLALKSQNSQHLPALEVYKNQSPTPLLRGRFGIDSTSIRQIDAKSTPEEGRARRIRGWGPGGLCLINPLTILAFLEFLAFFLSKEFLAFFSVFPSFPNPVLLFLVFLEFLVFLPARNSLFF